MGTGPWLERSREIDYSGLILHCGGHSYVVSQIVFRRKKSVLEESLEIRVGGSQICHLPGFRLPYTESQLPVRRKDVFKDRPYILRIKSDYKGYRECFLILPFYDFHFEEEKEYKIVGHEQITKTYYQSQVDPRLRLLIDTVSEKVPTLIDKAQDALLALLREKHKLQSAKMAFEEAESLYLKFDPYRKFERQHVEVTDKLNGGAQ